MICYIYFLFLKLNARFDDMKISISDEKKQVDEQRRLLDEQIADFHR